jgi:hypothetical protein
MPICEAVKNLNGHTALCFITDLANQEAEEMVYSLKGKCNNLKYGESQGINATSLLNPQIL